MILERSAPRIGLASCLCCEYDHQSTIDRNHKVAMVDTLRYTKPTRCFYVEPFVKTG